MRHRQPLLPRPPPLLPPEREQQTKRRQQQRQTQHLRIDVRALLDLHDCVRALWRGGAARE